MNKIIVTLKERRNLFSYDVELPLNIKVEQLKYHIVETIQALDTNVFEEQLSTAFSASVLVALL